KFAEIDWYSPPSAVKERDLNPDLTEGQGANNSHQVLAMSVPRRPTRGVDNTPGAEEKLWTGLTYALDPVGLDLSRAQFIDVWVNDFNDWHSGLAKVDRVRGLNLKLHVDVGVVSENQIRAPGEPPNTSLDSEDQPPRDGQLTVAG